MYNYRNKKKLIFSIIILLLLVIGIGYAYLTSNLSIAGNTQVTTNTWNIHFENLNVTTGSVTASSAVTINAAGDAINYTINLNRPKEFYEFTADIKNDGTLPGKISVSTLSGITSDAEPIIDYTIKYTNGNQVGIGDIINAGKKKTIKVRVFYKDDIDPTDFPANDLNLALTYTLQYVQSEEDEFNTNALIKQLKTENSSCFIKYEGDVTDRVGVTEEANNVYIDKCVDKRNIKFAGYCWQVIRTTETGGIKMIYNGEPIDGTCPSTYTYVDGIKFSSGTRQLNSNYLYGSSYTYDKESGIFTLIDTEEGTWSSSTFSSLLGKYTCKSLDNTCTDLFYVKKFYSNEAAYIIRIIKENKLNSLIGNSAYSDKTESPETIGYMFSDLYSYSNSSLASGSLMGNDVSYENGVYTLLPADGESELGTTKDNTHHYTCNTTSNTCTKVRYYYSDYYFIELNGAANIQAAINEMLYNDNVNRKDSTIKGVVDLWYLNMLNNKTNMLEDTVFCNNRTIRSLGGWDPDGSLNGDLYFVEETSTDLSCPNETDQFAVGNNKAKLTYPVSLITSQEANLYGTSMAAAQVEHWTLSTNHFGQMRPYTYTISGNGRLDTWIAFNSKGVRPVISLAPGNVIASGSGSESDPWVIDD